MSDELKALQARYELLGLSLTHALKQEAVFRIALEEIARLSRRALEPIPVEPAPTEGE